MKKTKQKPKRELRVWADVDLETIRVVDRECARLGQCSRASILRMVLRQWAAAQPAPDAECRTGQTQD